MTSENKNLLLYILKCVTGSAIVFLLSWLLDYPDMTWCIISVILVLTPESNEAIPLAVTRIKANMIAGVASFLSLLIFPATPVTIIFVIVITILGCYQFKTMSGSRAAIAAVIIIMMHGMETAAPDFWKVTLQRIGSVIAGCLIGLIVTLIYHRDLFRKNIAGIKSDEG
jgi:uncharacterized membrane protein YgaE (UPF0421/DUF939 family)